ncbi:MAG: undecaprenyl-diphosphate phosphatase [Erysipelotrichaceae bacterium]|nr:undecaprenyl-diphosphate phosphatase [Erysipelotrichaceae bacterium]
MINYLISILFGLIEGITEWLPISSTGHMIIFNNLIDFAVSEEFYKVYEVVIQLGAIMAVVVLFFKDIWPFGQSDEPLGKGILAIVRKDKMILWTKIIIACLPAAVIGLAFDDVFDALFYNPISVALALIIVGIAFIVIEKINMGKDASMKDIRDISYQTAVLIGVFQVIAAVFPGSSRSGCTIIGGLILGVSRAAATEFTFYLAIPVMFGASLLKIVKYGLAFSTTELSLLLAGSISAFIVSIFVIRFILSYIRKHDFRIFGYYRIAIGLIVLLYFGFIV